MNGRTIPGVLVLAIGLAGCEGRPAPPSVSFHDAIVARDTTAMKRHFEAGTDVNAADANGITPLIAAAASGQPDIIQSLLEAGADVNGPGPDGDTALIYAIRGKQAKAALFLLKQDGVDLEAYGTHGATALAAAVNSPQATIVEALLEGGADVNGTGPVGRTALHMAAMWLNPEMISLLLEQGADPNARNDEGATPLHHTALMPFDVNDAGDTDIQAALDLIIESTEDVDVLNNNGQAPLHLAVTWARPWIISTLLDAGASPMLLNQAGYTPVCYVTADQFGQPRDPAEALAIVALFRDAGMTDETVIDAKGTTLAAIDGWLRKQAMEKRTP